MLDPSRPTPIWAVWPYLSWLERLLFVALIVLGVYVLFSAVTTISRVRRARSSLRYKDSPNAKQVFAVLRKRSTRVDRLITTAFYLFGIVLFLGLQNAYVTIDNSKAAVGWLILMGFPQHFAFAATVFFVLLVLHVIGWFISHSVDRLPLP
jgi:hypothetical protein